LLYESKRVAVHQRDDTPGRFTTLEKHMPAEHLHYCQEQRDSSVERLITWAEQMGESSRKCVERFFQARSFPQQAIRAVLGLKRLAGIYGRESFEEACKKTIELGRFRYKTVEEILKHNLCGMKKTNAGTQTNINEVHFRGAQYYR